MRISKILLALLPVVGQLPTVTYGFQQRQPSQLTLPIKSRKPISISHNPARANDSYLFFSLPKGLVPGRGDKNPKKKINPIAFLRRLASGPINTAARFKKLSRRAKAVILVQLLCFSLIFGSVGRNIYVKSSNRLGLSPRAPVEVPYSSFLDLVDGTDTKELKNIVIDDIRIGKDRVSYRMVKKVAASDKEMALRAYSRMVPSAPPELIESLRSKNLLFSAAPVPKANTVAVVARTGVLAFYMIILYRMYKTFNTNTGGGSKTDAPGKLATVGRGMPLVSFNDIQGIDDVKLEVMELVDTLKYPEKYSILGARAPTGLLLEGPPGTGKTMLARATAAAAGIPLLYCSGSDFVEMFVGRGAARVRKLFERASKLSPCIIFIDELDALGKARDGFNSAFSSGRSNDEAEQTLNQLLACMDGLDTTRRICVLAATNRKEVLDPALIRPGRFDRIVTLKLPDARGREKILRVHCKKLPGFEEGEGVDPTRAGSLGKGNQVDLSAVAIATTGLSGAELEFLVNEAAIRTVRRVSAEIREGKTNVTSQVRPEDFEASLSNYYATRKPKGSVNDLLKGVWK